MPHRLAVLLAVMPAHAGPALAQQERAEAIGTGASGVVVPPGVVDECIRQVRAGRPNASITTRAPILAGPDNRVFVGMTVDGATLGWRDGRVRPDHGAAGLVLRSPSLAPLPDPVIHFQGGPGGATLNSFGQIRGGTDALRASRDIILFGQRGTGSRSYPSDRRSGRRSRDP